MATTRFYDTGLSRPKSAALADDYESNLVRLTKRACEQTLSVNHLVDMAWTFGGKGDTVKPQYSRVSL